jgi:poly(A) polymerase
VDAKLATWWEAFSLADPGEQRSLMDQARDEEAAKRLSTQPAKKTGGRTRRAATASQSSTDAVADASNEADVEFDLLDEAGATADEGGTSPARKRRRRRRKPAGEGRGPAPSSSGE